MAIQELVLKCYANGNTLGLSAALWEDYSITLLRISGFQKSLNVLHAQILPDVLLQKFAAVIAELQTLRIGRTDLVIEYKLSFLFHIELNGPF